MDGISTLGAGKRACGVRAYGHRGEFVSASINSQGKRGENDVRYNQAQKK